MRTGILLHFTLFCHLLHGQTQSIIGHNQKFIHHIENKGLVLIESLEPQMTLYSLARKYSMPLDSLLYTNPDLNPNEIPLGYPVNIPVTSRKISFDPPSAEDNKIWLSYRVQPKETLYRISKVFLHVDPEVIIALNPSAAHGLSIGQVLHVGWLVPSENLSYANMPDAGVGLDSLRYMPRDFIKEASRTGSTIKVQKGLAVWKPGNLSANYYVLHPTAKLGTYMEITNPMLHRTITAKVAGHIPPGLYQSHIGIVVSPSTARALGILDQQFFAKWRYVE